MEGDGAAAKPVAHPAASLENEGEVCGGASDAKVIYGQSLRGAIGTRDLLTVM